MAAIPLSDVASSLFPELAKAAHDSKPSPTEKVTSARSRNRSGAWERDLNQTYAYFAQQNLRPEERAQLDQLYELALAEGPDFTRYRSNSVFAAAQKVGIDRNAYARILHALEMIERGTYRAARQKGKQGLPRTLGRVLKALLGLALRYGTVFPSYDGIARLACVCRKTAISCVKLLQLYGFITVTRRAKRIATVFGSKTVQDTNAYMISEPTGLGALALSLFGKSSECKKYPASSSESYSNKGSARNLAPWGVPNGVYDTLYAEWEAS
jgi:hypothetical protein